ncbi:hypothetical protein [Ramlibacter sp.]|uniref:hypothetical protein n=1 Tax=Ramlibacter sp. TaxID=1917967 RepID=UPI002638AF55|nr:hypothetical protein [Ramlibacter sp.]MDB5953909.1 hypothetical protein [Ramlibacter sp.]
MRLGLLLAGSALLLAACANPWNTANIAAGATRDQVVARAGQPVAVLPLANGGQRMQYTLQPLGRYAFAVDLDASGHVVSSRQVLTEANFQRIETGAWTVADVQREFGPPAQIDTVASWNGPVWTYRWRDLGNNDMFYWVYFDRQGVVQRAHPGMEFINAPSDRY